MRSTDSLQTYDNPYWVTEHGHGDLFRVGGERRTEDSFLHFRMRARCDDFLDLLQKLGVEHPVRLVKNYMSDTAPTR